MWWYPSYKHETNPEPKQETPIPCEKRDTAPHTRPLVSPRKPVERDLTYLGHRNWGW